MTGQEVRDPAVSGEKALPASPPQFAAETGAQSSRGAEAGTSTACLGSQGASTRSLFRGSFPGRFVDQIRSHIPLEKPCTGGRSPHPGAPGWLVQNTPLPPRAQHPGPSRLGGRSRSSRVGRSR